MWTARSSFLEVKTEGSREATVKDRIPYDLTDRSRITAEGLVVRQRHARGNHRRRSRPVRSSLYWKPATGAPRCSCPDRTAGPHSTKGSPGIARAGAPGSSTGPWCWRQNPARRQVRWTAISGPAASGPAGSPSSPPAWPRCAPSFRPTAGTGRCGAVCTSRRPRPPDTQPTRSTSRPTPRHSPGSPARQQTPLQQSASAERAPADKAPP